VEALVFISFHDRGNFIPSGLLSYKPCSVNGDSISKKIELGKVEGV
jgi:hypothetical protein